MDVEEHTAVEPLATPLPSFLPGFECFVDSIFDEPEGLRIFEAGGAVNGQSVGVEQDLSQQTAAVLEGIVS